MESTEMRRNFVRSSVAELLAAQAARSFLPVHPGGAERVMAERAAVAPIVNCADDEARGFEDLARTLALKMGITPEAAAKLLAEAVLVERRKPRGASVAQVLNPDVGAVAGNETVADAVRSVVAAYKIAMGIPTPNVATAAAAGGSETVADAVRSIVEAYKIAMAQVPNSNVAAGAAASGETVADTVRSTVEAYKDARGVK